MRVNEMRDSKSRIEPEIRYSIDNKKAEQDNPVLLLFLSSSHLDYPKLESAFSSSTLDYSNPVPALRLLNHKHKDHSQCAD